jgi:hypothetical protein
MAGLGLALIAGGVAVALPYVAEASGCGSLGSGNSVYLNCVVNPGTAPYTAFNDGQHINISMGNNTTFDPNDALGGEVQAVECSYPGGADPTLPSQCFLPTEDGNWPVAVNDTPSKGSFDFTAQTGATQPAYGLPDSTFPGATISCNASNPCVFWIGEDFNNGFTSAPHVFSNPFTINPIAQAITFTTSAPGSAVNGGSHYNVGAVGGGSGNAIIFSSGTPGVCTVTGHVVNFVGGGSCTVNANQAGNANYTAAPQAQQTFSVGKADQTVSFTSTAPSTAQVGGASYNATASATSSLTPTITVDASAASVCSISGSTVSFTGAGTCTLDANQAGDANYNAAPQVQQSFSVAGLAGFHIDTMSLPDSTAGVAYSAMITASGGNAPYTFKVTAGALPKGLKLAATGAITGTPKDIVATDSFTVTAKDTKTNKIQQITTQDLSINVLQLAPVVAKVSKNFGPGAGGNTVTVKGLYMGYSTSPVTVFFGSVQATNVVVSTKGTSVTATAPAQSAGVVDVTVTTSWGTSSTNVNDEYTYFGPTVASIKPTAGPDAGGTTVTVKGTYFNGATQVLFGGVPGTGVIVASTGKALTVVSPAHASGSVDIQVVTPGGTSPAGPVDTYTYP